jgi:ribosome-binding protein aMBF1 (putative translation factor)
MAAQAKEMSRDDLDFEIDRHKTMIRSIRDEIEASDYRDDEFGRRLEQISNFFDVLLTERRFRILFNDEDYTRN